MEGVADISKDTLLAILDALPQCVSLKDLQGHFIYINQADAFLYNATPAEMIGQTAEPWVGREQYLAWLEGDNLEIAGGKPVYYPIYKRTDVQGKDQWFDTIKIPIRGTNGEGFEYLLVVHRDVTQIKRAEEERDAANWQSIQTQKLEIAGILAGNIAHSFNNYLATVANATELFRRPETLSASDRESLITVLEKTTAEAGFLIQQIQVMANKAEPLLVELELRNFLTGTAPLWKSVLGDHHPLQLRLGEEEVTIFGDERLLQQALINLLHNARAALMQGKGVTIELKIVENRAWIIVTDEGSGMSAEVSQRAFDPFFTTHSSGERVGLGLTTVQSIMKLHGGEVALETASQVGTTVTLKIALYAKPVKQARPTRSSKAARLLGCRILLVDDNQQLRWVTSRMLESLGAKVLEAESPDAALQLWAELPPEIDCVISDVIMPGTLDGLELREVLGQRYPLLPVLLISGYSFDRRNDYNLPERTGFLLKPFNLPQLLQALEGLLQPAAQLESQPVS
jgi:two-component system, cell cycle sensor histidine kinase and response regulator CckA